MARQIGSSIDLSRAIDDAVDTRRENMRRIVMVLAAAALWAIAPALALANNQETAEKIAKKLRDSEFRVGVKFQDGTAWLRGRVADDQQAQEAVKLAFQTPGVSRVINELTIGPADGTSVNAKSSSPDANAVSSAKRKAEKPEKASPSLGQRLETFLGGSPDQDDATAERVPSSFARTAARPVSIQEVQDDTPQQAAAPVQRVPANKPTKYVAMQQTPVRGPTAPMASNGAPLPMYRAAGGNAGVAPARYDQPCMPNYAWPSYAAYPNYAALSYPKQYSPTAWPYIGPFYPYPQVPLGWRKVTLEWDDGWWFLDFKDSPASAWHR
jgi:hypothetical protein